jgi:hypothetical protein
MRVDPRGEVKHFPCGTTVFSHHPRENRCAATVSDTLVCMLEDGTYDAVIVDADDVDGSDGVLHVELTIVAGPSIGEVVSVRGRFPGRDALELLGLPATIVVADGKPDVRVDA